MGCGSGQGFISHSCDEPGKHLGSLSLSLVQGILSLFIEDGARLRSLIQTWVTPKNRALVMAITLVAYPSNDPGSVVGGILIAACRGIGPRWRRDIDCAGNLLGKPPALEC